LYDIVRKKGQAEVIISNISEQSLNYITGKLSVASVKDGNVHIILSPLTVEWFITQRYDYGIIERVEAKGVSVPADIEEAMEWETYPSYTQYDSIMKKFGTDYPSLADIDTIGTSINGRLVLAVKVSDAADIDEDEPEVFLTSSMHGDETGGFVLMLHLADFLLKNYPGNARVKNIVDNLEIWINPLANPDGMYRTGNIMSSPTRFNANGVDLNRNFPDPEEPGKIAEKETSDMTDFLSRHRFVLSVNFHSGAEVVNYPWDRWFRLHADNEWFYRISRNYADTVHKYSVPGYMTFLDNGVTNGYDWYKVNGGRQDFVTYELQGREVTIELDNDYITPVNQLGPLWNYNWRSLLGYIENAFFGIRGKVTSALTSVPVAAKIFIPRHDKDNSNVYSDSLTGRFVRLIEPGTWDLLFTAVGYRDLLLTGVTVGDDQAADINVEMYPEINPVDTMDTESPVLYPNPAETFIKAVLPERQYGRINVRVFTSSGVKISDYNTDYGKGFPIYIDITGLSGGVYTVIFTNTATGIRDKGRFVVLHR
jgi:hypothetical protein